MRKIATLRCTKIGLMIAGLAFVVGAATGSLVTKANIDRDLASLNEEAHLGQRRLINPLLECPDHPHGPSPKEVALQEAVDHSIEDFKSHSPKAEVSVYFRDLNNGPTVLVNPKAAYIGASLMKLPVAIGYYLKAESDRSLLEKSIPFNPQKDIPPNIQQTVNPPKSMDAGKSYKIGDLIDRMLEESDNEASAMLLNYDENLNVQDVLRDMGIPTTIKSSEAWVTVRDYASIFRILYNSTYLSRGASNRLLETLAKADFDGGLRAGLPPGFLVSQKFGERTLDNVRQMHDCGIVYYPKRPYLLCVMTRGPYPIQELDKVVQGISKAIYTSISEDH